MKTPKQRLIKNIFSNWAAMFISAIIGFFMSPFLVHSLGKDQYGILILITSIIAYSSFLDPGMKQSLARFLPKYYAVKDFVKLNEIINSSNLIYCFIAFLTVLGTIVVSFFFLDLFNVSPDFMSIMRTALIIVGISQAWNLLLITSTALGPFHRYDLLNATNIIRSILATLVTIYFVINGYGIITIAIINLIANVLFSIVRRHIQQKIIPQIRFHIKYIKKDRIRELMSYGLISFFIVVSWMIIFNTDNIIIGLFLSTTAITYYSIANTIITQLRMVISSIGVPLVPTISHIDSTSHNTNETVDLFTKLSNYLYYITTCTCIGILVFGARFIFLWMGPEFVDTVKVLYILAIPASIYLPQSIANSILLGIGKHRSILYVLIAEAISNIVLSILLIKHFGIFGVAFGTAVPQLVIYSFVYPYVFSKIIKNKLKLYYFNSLRMVLTGIIFTLPISLVADKFIEFEGWFGFIIDIAIVGLVIVAGFVWKVLSVDDRKRVISNIKMH